MRGVNVLVEAGASRHVRPPCTRSISICQGTVNCASAGRRKRANRTGTVSTCPGRPSLSRQFQTNAAKRILLTRTRPHESNASDAIASLEDEERSLHDVPTLTEEKVLSAIEEGEPAKLAHAFRNPEYSWVFTRLPGAIFVEALRLLSPTYFVEPHREIQAHMHLKHFSKTVRPLRDIFAEFARRLGDVVEARRYIGHRLGLAEYTHLLRCAASMGDMPMAEAYWERMGNEGIVPSVECYNHYMDAKVRHNTYYFGENYNVSAKEFTYWKRRHESRSPGYTGYATGHGGTRDQVLDLLKEMRENGLEPDTATYAHVMVAYSRDWDLEAVRKTLKDVWNVDAEILAQDPGEHPAVTQYPISSPLYPTYDLLYAIAHVFGTNRDFSTALQIIDFISRRYDVPIPERAWNELLNWAFQLSSRHYRPDTRREDKGKRFPTKFVLDTCSTMTSEPYNIRPSTRTYDILMKTHWHRQTWLPFVRDFRAGVKMFTEILSQRNRLKNELDSLPPHSVPADVRDREFHLALFPPKDCEYLVPSQTSSAHYWHTFHAFLLQHLRIISDSASVKRWGSLLFSRRRWHFQYEWERRDVPDAIMEFKPYLPDPLYYRTSGGTVHFDSETVWPGGKGRIDDWIKLPRQRKETILGGTSSHEQNQTPLES